MPVASRRGNQDIIAASAPRDGAFLMRSRNIKPGFYLNERLAECQPLARILFTGLWCSADREGRLEDRPKRIKAQVLPYDNCDCDALLQELADGGFIVRYVVAGERFIAIPEFLKHQKPHPRENASAIPRHDLGNTQALPSPGNSGTGPADSSFLIPDSSSLIPEIPSLRLGGDTASPVSPCPVGEIVKLYHETLPMLPTVEKITKARGGYIRQRWREDLPELDHWKNYFAYVAQSRFLTGRTEGRDGKPPFRADLEWITKPGNFAKIAEGKYHA